MWFSFVHASIGKYRIGYAESIDGYSWERTDAEDKIHTDNQHAKDMICYPNVFLYKNRMYMLYNGDNFGYMGFGLAVFILRPVPLMAR